MSKRDKTLTTLLTLIVVAVFTTFTYGFLGVVNNSDAQTASITTGTISLTFADGSSAFKPTQLAFGKSIDKKFKITNTGTYDASATLYFKNLINTYTAESLSYSVGYSTVENGSYTDLKLDSNIPRSEIASKMTILNDIIIPQGKTYYYRIRITLNHLKDINQTADFDAILSTGFDLEAHNKDHVITLANNTQTTLTNYRIYGNSIQNGTPTVDNPIDIQSVGEKTKNLINAKTVKDINVYIDSTYGGERTPSASSGATWRASDFIPIESGKQYYFNANNSNASQAGIAWYNENKSYLSGASTTVINQNNKVLTAPNGAKYVRVSWRIESEYNPYWQNTVQLEEGNKFTGFDKYGYKIPIDINGQVTNIYLDEPLRKLSSYEDYIDFETGTVVRNFDKLVITGTESWSKSAGNADKLCVNMALNNDVANYNSESIKNEIKSNSFTVNYMQATRATADYMEEKFTAAKSTNRLYLSILSNRLETNDIAGFKKYAANLYAAGTPIYVIYKNKTPRIEEVDLPTITLPQGNVKITVKTSVPPSGVSLS